MIPSGTSSNSCPLRVAASLPAKAACAGCVMHPRIASIVWLGINAAHASSSGLLGYARRAVEAVQSFPAFVTELRSKVAKFSGREVEEFQQGEVNEYPPGAGIGWHKDKPEFGVIVGVSLLRLATMRFRRRKDNGWMRISHILKPRSIYILEGESRSLWEHSIPPLGALRYSLTFRTLR
jgi:hypothetical protein